MLVDLLVVGDCWCLVFFFFFFFVDDICGFLGTQIRAHNLLEKVCERGILCRQTRIVLFGYFRKHRIYQGNIMSPPLTHQHSVFRVPQALVFPNRKRW
jgi:hypothetical protein